MKIAVLKFSWRISKWRQRRLTLIRFKNKCWLKHKKTSKALVHRGRAEGPRRGTGVCSLLLLLWPQHLFCTLLRAEACNAGHAHHPRPPASRLPLACGRRRLVLFGCPPRRSGRLRCFRGACTRQHEGGLMWACLAQQTALRRNGGGGGGERRGTPTATPTRGRQLAATAAFPPAAALTAAGGRSGRRIQAATGLQPPPTATRGGGPVSALHGTAVGAARKCYEFSACPCRMTRSRFVAQRRLTLRPPWQC